MERKTISIAYQIKKEDELSASEMELIKAAKAVAQNAYAPYSNFKVGAALRLKDGTICRGSNQENAAYPSGLCAERVALYYAGANYPDVELEALAICALKEDVFSSNPISPCGSCRQVINESFERQQKPFKLILYGSEESYVFENANALLPLSFDHREL